MPLDADDHEFWVQLQTQLGVAPPLQGFLDQCGYKSASLFAFAFSNAQQFEDFLTKAFTTGGLALALGLEVDGWVWSPQVSCMRRLWHHCTNMNMQEEVSPPPAPAPAQPSPLDWADQLPPKLQFDAMQKMIRQFKEDYPAELLEKTTLPGDRLWAKVNQMCTKGGHFVWIPWTHCLSKKQEEEFQEARANKTPRSDAVSLLQLAWDAPPCMEESDLRAAPYFIGGLQAVRRNALALCKAAHLGNLKLLDSKMLAKYTATYPADSSLRAPNLKEFMVAERHVWEECYRLVNEENWTLDEALHELSTVRLDINMWLQPRPKAPSVPASSAKGSGKAKDARRQAGRPKGRGPSSSTGGPQRPRSRSRQRSKGQSKSKPASGGKDGQKQFCFRWNSGNCMATPCKFMHACNALVNGKPCGKSHRAIEHSEKSGQR